MILVLNVPAYVTALAITPLPTATLTTTFVDPTVTLTLDNEMLELRLPPPLSTFAAELYAAEESHTEIFSELPSAPGHFAIYCKSASPA